MSMQTAERILETEIKSNPDTYFSVQILGGEPLLSFDLIKHCYTFAKKITHNIRFMVATNGLLLDDKKFNWFVNHSQDMQLAISCDGPSEESNANRSYSFNEQLIHKYLKEYPKPIICLRITPSSLKNLFRDILYFHNINNKCEIQIGRIIDKNIKFTSELVSEYKLQLESLYQYYINNSQVTPCSLFNASSYNIKDFDDDFNCLNIKDRSCYDIDGRVSICLPLSSFVSNMTDEMNLDMRNNKPKIPEKCQSCLFRYSCCNCYGNNLLYTGNPLSIDTSVCEFVKLEYYYMARVILGFENSRSDIQNYDILKEKAIKILNQLEGE